MTPTPLIGRVGAQHEPLPHARCLFHTPQGPKLSLGRHEPFSPAFPRLGTLLPLPGAGRHGCHIGPPAASGGKFTVSLLDVNWPQKNNYLEALQSVGRTASREPQ